MDFSKIKEKAKSLKEKTVNKLTKSLSESKLVIKDIDSLKENIEKSKNTSFLDKKTQERKKIIKHSIIIFSGGNEEFYKDFLGVFPILATKAWAQNINLKLCDLEEENLKEYNIYDFPALVLFTNKRLKKVIYGEEDIKKIVKSLNFNIISKINNF